MPGTMEKTGDKREIQKYTALIGRLEDILSEIEETRRETDARFERLEEECISVLSDAKAIFHESCTIAEHYGIDIIPDLPISDGKLKRAWIALFRHQRGATADEIAEDLGRHRTTVSTYLNRLAEIGLAESERVGHEVYYKAVLKNDKGRVG